MRNETQFANEASFMKANVARCLLVTPSLAACAHNRDGARLTGEHARYGVEATAGGIQLPTPPGGALENFPSTVRFDNANGFVVEGGIARFEGPGICAGCEQPCAVVKLAQVWR